MQIRHSLSKILRLTFATFTALSILWASYADAGESKHRTYLELGITASSLLIQPSIGFWWGRIGVRFSGMYLNKNHHEFHFNIGYAFYDSDKVQHSINLLTSRVVGRDPGAHYRYSATGIAYSINYRGFFLELGLAHPWRDEIGNLAKNPVIPCGYFGYIYRFRPND